MSTDSHKAKQKKDKLFHIQFQADFLVQFQLHDKERVAGLTLTEWRLEPQDNERMRIVVLRKEEELLNGRILDLVIVCLAA